MNSFWSASSRPTPKTSLLSATEGFSLVEMMVSSTVMLVVLATTMTSFGHAVTANETVTQLSDSNQSLRSGTQFLIRDLLQAGWGGIPTGGVPIPTGGVPVMRPSPPGLVYYFDDGFGVVPAVTPGAGLGPAISGQPTDIISILYVDNNSPLKQTLVTLGDEGEYMEVPIATSITEQDNAVRQGDLILFNNAIGYALQEVTRTEGQTAFFESTNVSNLNQPGAPAGSITHLKTGSTFPPTSATRIKMITYYLDNITDPAAPRLVRQENYRTPRAMAGAMDDLQLTYDINDGLTNPTNVENPTDPSPNQIRKVNLEIGVRSEDLSSQMHKYKRNRIRTQVSLRSLSYVNRYE